MSLESIASAGSLAEEFISSMRITQAFGTQEVLSNKYDAPVNVALKAGMKAAAWRGGGVATFFFVLYSGYALGIPLHSY